MRPWWRRTPCHTRRVDAWITREFTERGLVPPNCTPAALARALERERQLTIVFQPYASDDLGVYGLLYRPATCERTYMILFRPTQSLVLRRVILFHELAHLLFAHPLTEVAGVGTLRGYLVADEDDAIAEAFAVGAMQYSFMEERAVRRPPQAEDDSGTSVFGHFLRRTQYWP